MCIFFTFDTNNVCSVIFAALTAFRFVTLTIFYVFSTKITLETYLTYTFELWHSTKMLRWNLVLEVFLHLLESHFGSFF